MIILRFTTISMSVSVKFPSRGKLVLVVVDINLLSIELLVVEVCLLPTITLNLLKSRQIRNQA